MTSAYISMGSNLGDRQANILTATRLLSDNAKILIISSIYETEPEGYKKQPDFLNCVVNVEVETDAPTLLTKLKNIEERMGREQSFKNAARIIDLDLLFFNQDIIREPDLEVPHPRLLERSFVLVPMVEIAAGFTHPALHKTMTQLLNELKSGSRVKLWGVKQAGSTGS
jgi:2-amino-4-hydroxy-6-hydroxymethyldihydropteridine diphosphokinase